MPKDKKKDNNMLNKNVLSDAIFDALTKYKENEEKQKAELQERIKRENSIKKLFYHIPNDNSNNCKCKDYFIAAVNAALVLFQFFFWTPKEAKKKIDCSLLMFQYIYCLICIALIIGIIYIGIITLNTTPELFNQIVIVLLCYTLVRIIYLAFCHDIQYEKLERLSAILPIYVAIFSLIISLVAIGKHFSI